LGLLDCSADEKNLIDLQKTKACHYVGTYCSNSTFFGICLTKTMNYCCFQGALPRIINEAGRPQVGKGWGSAKHPDCSGFTVAQFQSLDLSNVDFSDFYSATLDKLVPPGAGGVTAQVQSTLSSLAAGAVPTTLPTIH
jgi:conjugal transfer mating pair stabilization protein TraN